MPLARTRGTAPASKVRPRFAVEGRKDLPGKICLAYG